LPVAGRARWPVQRAQDRRGLLLPGERRHHMVSLASVLGETLEFQNPPAEMASDRAIGEDGGLDPLRRDRNVGECQKSPATSEARLRAVQPEPMFAKQGADQAGADAKQ